MPASAATRSWRTSFRSSVLPASGIRSAALLATLVALLVAAPAAAQHVERTGRGDVALDRRLDRLLESGDYLLVTNDTLISDSVPRAVLVLDATLTLEGAVAGDLVGVDANMFVRPGARVHGDVVNVAGGLYRSAIANVGGSVVDLPLATYRVIRREGVMTIEAQSEEPALKLNGILGFEPPTYDRVDALGLTWGASYSIPPIAGVQPRLEGAISYRSGRGALNGDAALLLDRARATLAIGVEEWTETNDRWIRGDLRNSLTFAYKGSDYRNYYEAERIYSELAYHFGEGDRTLVARLRGQLEDASSLGAGDPWTLFGDDPRPNPPIDEGRITSLIGGAEGEWVGQTAMIEGEVRVELAENLLGGDFSFGRVVFLGEWAMQALADHTLEMEWFVQGVLPGTSSLPRQRWSFVGGSGTLGTFGTAQFRGDRIVFVETDYIIPLPRRWRLPILGAPSLELEHDVGMAWTDAIERDFEQNLGVRLQFFGVYLRVRTNPDNPVDDAEFDIGLSWPFGDARPWERN